jgi:hypothetical protein
VSVFTLEAFNAEEGDCFLLAFGDQSEISRRRSGSLFSGVKRTGVLA